MNYPRAHIMPVGHKEDKPQYWLQRDFTSAPEHEGIFVPKGFLYDGSTQLSLFDGGVHIGLRMDGEHREAALLHDWLYVNDGKLPDGRRFTRKQADKLMYKMMLDYGVKKKRAKRAYVVIRMVGWIPWMQGNGEPQII